MGKLKRDDLAGCSDLGVRDASPTLLPASRPSYVALQLTVTPTPLQTRLAHPDPDSQGLVYTYVCIVEYTRVLSDFFACHAATLEQRH